MIVRCAILLPALFVSALAIAAQSDAAPVIDFVPESPGFSAATEEYRDIWAHEGERISAALEEATGLRLESGPIRTIVFEGVSNSGYRDIPMRMRASYPLDTKRATLVHELSHRLISDFFPRDFEEHPVIFLFLYDVWVELWGKDFADAQVAVEGERRGRYDYEGAWKEALALSAEERAARWSRIRAEVGAGS